MVDEESVEDWNDKRCLSYDWCKEASDEVNLHCEDCDHKQYEIEPKYFMEIAE